MAAPADRIDKYHVFYRREIFTGKFSSPACISKLLHFFKMMFNHYRKPFIYRGLCRRSCGSATADQQFVTNVIFIFDSCHFVKH